MPDYQNPYQSPEAQIVPEAKQSTGVELTFDMLKYLYEASPWLRFIGIMGYIGASGMILLGIILSLGMTAFSSLAGISSGLGAIFAVYIPIGVLFFLPAHFTYTCGKKIRDFRFTSSTTDLEIALKNNKSLWKFLGIYTIVTLAFIPVSLIVGIIIGVVTVFGTVY